MMSEFFPLIRILFTDPLVVKSEFHGPPPSPLIRTSFMDVPLFKSYNQKGLSLIIGPSL